jgi:hypothetical protein
VKQQLVVKDKKLRSQINGKFNDMSSADESIYQNITVEPLFKNYEKTIHLFFDRRLRSCTWFQT